MQIRIQPLSIGFAAAKMGVYGRPSLRERQTGRCPPHYNRNCVRNRGTAVRTLNLLAGRNSTRRSVGQPNDFLQTSNTTFSEFLRGGVPKRDGSCAALVGLPVYQNY